MKIIISKVDYSVAGNIWGAHNKDDDEFAFTATGETKEMAVYNLLHEFLEDGRALEIMDEINGN